MQFTYVKYRNSTSVSENSMIALHYYRYGGRRGGLIARKCLNATLVLLAREKVFARKRRNGMIILMIRIPLWDD